MRLLCIRESAWLNGTPQSVWRVLSALEEWPRWNQEVLSACWRGDGGWREGQRFHLTLGDRALPFHGAGRVLCVVPHERLSWRGRYYAFPVDLDLAVETDGGGSRVSLSSTFRGLATWFAGAAPVARRISRFERRFLNALENTVEHVVGSKL